MPGHKTSKQWQFWIDRGGTFTDVVALNPEGRLVVRKLLSEDRQHYQDAALQAIKEILTVGSDGTIPPRSIAAVKMGTTVATNALLERKGEPVVLAITAGFKDALAIAYQNRPDIFALQIKLPELLYEQVIEVKERYSASGEELLPLDRRRARADLQRAYNNGYRCCAIVLMHGYRYQEHEKQLADIARQIGFTHVSISHQTIALMKLVSRGDTTLADAYLSPVLDHYVEKMQRELKGTPLLFMQSNGGLAAAGQFHGKDSILSGPAGGIIGAVKTSSQAGLNKIITFDMGGTSTDVAHYEGELERSAESLIGGVRLRAPMLSINTVAAGGGSILRFDGCRYRVGPESAGADPGPACYRKGGPLTVTDCNVMLGKIQPAYFPKVFGQGGKESIDQKTVTKLFANLTEEIRRQTGDSRTAEEVAAGFLSIAVTKMAAAIKQVSTQRGHDLSQYTLICFGGAGGQHACLIAESLCIDHIFIHPLAGVLSALGIGLSDIRAIKEQAVELPLTDQTLKNMEAVLADLSQAALLELEAQTLDPAAITVKSSARLRYAGTDSTLTVGIESGSGMLEAFSELHKQRYGFNQPGTQVLIESVTVEAAGRMFQADDLEMETSPSSRLSPVTAVKMYSRGGFHNTPLFLREHLSPGDRLLGPAIIAEAAATTIVEPGWYADIDERANLILTRDRSSPYADSPPAFDNVDAALRPDPVLLEVFNSLFMFVAEQMGVTLQNTSHSVNIKERLDFSCAIFDDTGNLIANAPHIPVHLGSMGESVQQLIAACGDRLRPGDVYALNDPYHGGTHLPDITVITPVFDEDNNSILYFVASRGHHADIGGITPGSMPPGSKTVNEEGVLIDNFLLVEQGCLREREMRDLLLSGDCPARNPEQNIADLKAQIAANNCGRLELEKMVRHYGLPAVKAYMAHVQDNAEESVRRVIDCLQGGSCAYQMDNGATIAVTITIDRDKRSATVDFSGTAPQQPDNFNAPEAVCKAAVLYVFRTLVKDDIPLNAGCLKPLKLIIPEGSLLKPSYPAAVVAGNVETSQVIVDTLYGALGIMAASQGTMNNFTFGDDRHQYYETICGGAGAGSTFPGCDAVQTHMTNSRLTDPEVLEWRFPVLVDSFAIRAGSGGEGQYRGGNGVVRRLKFKEPMTASILSGRRKIAPAGLAGGKPGAPGRNYLETPDGTIVELGATASVKMNPGDVFVIETPGGGGFGAKE